MGDTALSRYWDAWTTGKGTPWGPTENSNPSVDFIEDPYSASIHAPDQGPLRQAMMGRIRKGAGRSQAGALAGLQKAGVQGADTSRAIGRVAESENEDIGALEAGLGQQDFNNRLGLMGSINQARRAKYDQEMDAYNHNKDEENERGQFWGGVAKTVGSLFGGR